MQYNPTMITNYLAQLQAQATNIGVELKDAFILAGVADSTFYRARSGSYDLTYSTAIKVAEWMDDHAPAAT